MKKSRSIVAASLLAVLGTTGAIAQGATTEGTMSRQEVVAELRAAQAAGWQPVQEVSPTPLEAIDMERKSFDSPSTPYSSMRDGRMNNRVDPQPRSPMQDETKSLQNVPNQQVPPAR